MFPVVDLIELAEDLRGRSVDANYAILYGPHGGLEGLEVGEDFFPLWELNLPENRVAVEKLDFAVIKSRRAANWSPELPRYAHSTGV